MKKRFKGTSSWQIYFLVSLASLIVIGGGTAYFFLRTEWLGGQQLLQRKVDNLNLQLSFLEHIVSLTPSAQSQSIAPMSGDIAFTNSNTGLSMLVPTNLTSVSEILDQIQVGKNAPEKSSCFLFSSGSDPSQVILSTTCYPNGPLSVNDQSLFVLVTSPASSSINWQSFSTSAPSSDFTTGDGKRGQLRQYSSDSCSEDNGTHPCYEGSFVISAAKYHYLFIFSVSGSSSQNKYGPIFKNIISSISLDS